ncbi:MAG: protease-like activity factor CPAF [Bdellovibrionaceae bacterium]|nr:protease-like activity factor CPAF [Pseudobdellovibrionaceae bacterium]
MFKIVSWFSIIVLGIAINSNVAFSQKLTKEQRLLDFHYLVSHIKSSYGPLEYKTKNRIVNINKLIKKFRKKVAKAKTNGEFYYTIREFTSSFRDGHFSTRIPTSYRASLPLRTEWVNGKILVQLALPVPGNIQLSPGDEILKFNNKPVKKVLRQLKKYIGSGSKQTETRWAAWLLTIRPGSLLPVPVNNKVILRVKLKSSGKIVNVNRKWKFSGEFLDENKKFGKKSKNLQNFSGNQSVVFNPIENLSISDSFDSLLKEDSFAEVTYACSPSTRIAIPADATVIMKEPFVAYYYPTKKGNVGYLRIPHYSFGEQSKQVFANYAYAVSELEKNTVALVIDQDHNCGGSVTFLGDMFGLFIDRPVNNALFRLVANKSVYISLKSYVERASPNVIGFSIWKHFLAQVKTAWLGNKYLTDKISLQKIYPNAEARYTKPITVLTDELSGSGGDAFPALMQGYNRATILGTKTSGLGGSVASIPNLPFSQISVRLTQTLFYHPNGQEIENNGVNPDVPYTITDKDFINKYLDYRTFYTQKTLDLL